jgi:hypothetical protein
MQKIFSASKVSFDALMRFYHEILTLPGGPELVCTSIFRVSTVHLPWNVVESFCVASHPHCSLGFSSSRSAKWPSLQDIKLFNQRLGYKLLSELPISPQDVK